MSVKMYGATYSTRDENYGEITSVFKIDHDWVGDVFEGYTYITEEEYKYFNNILDSAIVSKFIPNQPNILVSKLKVKTKLPVVVNKETTYAGGGYGWYRTITITRKGKHIAYYEGKMNDSKLDSPKRVIQVDWSVTRPGDIVEIEYSKMHKDLYVVPSESTRIRYEKAKPIDPLWLRLHRHYIRKAQEANYSALSEM